MPSRSLPRIDFRTAAPAVERVLPRMDVVGFVGFAARGQEHVPVAIENTGQFAAQFGDDWEIAGGGKRRRSYLGAAVRAFFQNGGLRCYVVRVPAPADGFDPLAFVDSRFVDMDRHALASGLEAAMQALVTKPHVDPSEPAVEPALRGAHALLAVDEVSVFAIPDLGQLPWRAVRHDGKLRLDEVAQPPSGFGVCPGHVPPPRWLLTDLPRTLAWEKSSLEDVRYRLEWLATAEQTPPLDSEMAGANVALTHESVHTLEPGEDKPDKRRAFIAWFRVRTEPTAPGAPPGSWSRWRRVSLPWSWQLETMALHADAVLRAQVALLRMCAWRGDVMALLHVPGAPLDGGAEVATSRAWLSQLAGALPVTERQCLTHGAAYAPWFEVREEDGERRATPPDGAIAGTWALLARTEGAWRAPGNVALRAIVRPTTAASDEQATQLLADRGNPLLRGAAGTVALGAYTLAGEGDDVQHIHVRRLLCLLRRLAMRYGYDQVFEPLGPAFVRAVRSNFTAVLTELYRRGAFAGDRPEHAFRVDVLPDFERARCVVELRVAPAMPLTFLTIRLVLEHGRLAAEGA